MDAPGLATAELRPDAPAPRTRESWWRERECRLVALLVLAIYFSRPTALSIRGEESRWANVAREMLETGDFIVPREQGAVFANRPPLANWCLALATAAVGRQDAWVVRLPALVATLLTTLLIYGCGRAFLSRSGALIAALAFAGMGQVLQLGRQAETEPILTLCVAASLLGWLACYLRGRSPWITWLVGYGFAALAGLAKGPQGPVYFVGTTWLFLLCFDRALLRHRAHIAGIALFLVLIAAWQVPLIEAVGAQDAWSIWSSEAGRRLTHVTSFGALAAHALRFPWEVVGCMLPWSGLLLGFADRTLRQNLGSLKRPTQFLGIASVVGLLPLLATTQARGRYFMPLYPCTALLAAIVVETSLAPAMARRATQAWRGFLLVCAVMAPAGAIFVFSASVVPYWSSGPYAQSFATVAIFTACALLTAWLCREALLRYGRRTSQIAACAIAGFCGLAYTLVVTNAYIARSSDPQLDVVRLCERVPADAQFVSFSTVHHLFAYHLAQVSGRSVRRVDEPSADAAARPDWEYFCLNSYEPRTSPLPFRWEQVAVVAVDRNRYDPPRDYVVIGRRLPAAEGAEAGAPAHESPRRTSPALEAAAPKGVAR